MENYDDILPGQEPVEDIHKEEEQSVQEEETVQEAELVQEEPAQPQEPQSARKESPFADSPYVNVVRHPEPQQPRQTYTPYDPPVKKKAKKQGSGKLLKRFVAAMLVIVLVAGSCYATAFMVNSRWESETSRVYTELNQKITELQNQLDAQAPSTTGDSVSGSPVSSISGSMTPAQVYAQNKQSVVAISCTTLISYGYTQQQATSSGSGFIYSADGYVITNYHVVEGATTIEVVTYDGETYTAQLKGYDSTNDLAVLKVEAQGLQPAKIGSSSNLIIGDMVVAIGNPLGELTSTQTVGYVSGKDREISTDGTVINMLQTDAAINPGNSGGPLFNMYGEVVGITTAKYSGTTSSGASIEGIGFAIPIDDVTGMISDIIEHGYVTGAYLGVMVMDMDSQTASIYRLPVGAYVDSVTDGSCAQKAGVRQGDIIVAMGDIEVENRTDLQRALRQFKPGDTTTITVFRSGTEVKLTITLDEKPQQTTTQVQPEATEPTESQEEESSGRGGVFGWPFG